ncbi:TonB-dependent receptor [Caulobacter soli]|uniref:TonB-dependent receptor n=1 Tax=Caulobacter soli TaxID=2708539 RepID=UPI0013EACBAF|nr:TonB-dependent receptor [Caulobacter soli]
MRFQLMMIGAVSSLALSTGMAHAAETPQTATDPDNTVEAVIITGEKASRTVQQTVTSVAVTTAARIERENIRTLYDVVARTANMSETYGKTGFTIRGISNSNVSGGGTGGLSTVYVDGAALPETAVYSGPLEMWDIQQVEVLRGPQSTLQGRNSLAGAIIVRSTDPSFDWGFRARATVASGDERSIAVAGGGPIVADQLAFRVAAEKKKSDGFIYNTTRHEDVDAVDNLYIRGKLLLTPTALPGLKVMATYAHNKRDAGYLFSYSRTDTPDYYDHRLDYSNDPNHMAGKVDIYTLDSSYKLNDRLTVTGIASWNEVTTRGQFDSDYTAARLAFGERNQHIKTSSQELRLNYEGDRLKGLIGLYHAKRDTEDTTASITNVAFPKATLVSVLTSTLLAGVPNPTPIQQAGAAAQANAFANLYVAALPVIPVDYKGSQPEIVQTTALFADGSFALTPKLSVLGGLRYDHEENTGHSVQSATFVGTYPTPASFGPYAPYVTLVNQFVGNMVAQANASAPGDTRKFNAWLPKVGVKYDWTSDIATSLTAQRGYRSGGQSVNIARSTVKPYDEEYTWNYEASLRTAWLDGSLTVNANAFYLDWKDQQVLVNLGLNTYDYQVENAGKSHDYGFELEVAQRVDEHLSWYASLGYTRTKFDDFNVTVGTTTTDLSGAEFPYAPHWTLASGVDYRWGNGFVGHLDGNYRSKAFSQAQVDPTAADVVKAHVMFNGRFGYERDHWGAYVFGKNLLNATWSQYSREDVPLALLSEPRVFGLTIETRW